MRREAGNWLLNDSIFVASGENVVAPNTPPFLINLRRDKKAKLPLFRPAATRGPLNFATLPLPPLREMNTSTFDFVALQSSLTSQVAAARASGRVFLGFSLPAGGAIASSTTPEGMKAFFKPLRAVLDAVAPEAALVLDVDATADPNAALNDIDRAAPFCDALVLRVNPSDASALWPLKMARRVAEEQPDYDLPIFVAPKAALSSPEGDGRLLEFFMGGATGFILPDTQIPGWANGVARNAGLFASAVTLEDAAILPSSNRLTSQIERDLRSLGRVPLVGRLPDGARAGESLMAILDEQTPLSVLSGLDKAARNGATIYLEGLPNLSDKAILDKMADMTSSTIEIMSNPKPEVLSLDDVWLFGDARGQEFAVTQRVKWTPKTSIASQTRIKPGEPSPLPFSSARLAGDSNGLLNAPLGRGRILWLAHSPLAAKADDAARRGFLRAIAGNLQGSLARWKFVSGQDEAQNGGRLHLALRSSKAGTPIVAVFNSSDRDAPISLSARSDAALALDLSDEKEQVTTVVGYSATFPVTVPARGFRWFALGANRKALDKERLTPRPKAKVR